MRRGLFQLVLLVAAAGSPHDAGGDATLDRQPPQIHAFYYLWYGNPDENNAWRHWDHTVLPHWDAQVRRRFAHFDGKKHSPPEWLHSPFYPQLGPYSSTSRATLDAHFESMRRFEIDAAVLSWTGRNVSSDTQGVATDEVFPAAIAAARRAGVGVAVHLEPYPGRSPATVRDDLGYLVSNYGDSLMKMRGRPVVYVYDAYHSPSKEWAELFCDGAAGVFAIATVLQESELAGLVEKGCFDGFYSYFATEGFTFGSSTRNWPALQAFAEKHDKVFVPSVGPGYNDTRIRPWNGAATRDRRNGEYYNAMLTAAISADPDVISITSFNEWGEGTQVEPARLPDGLNGLIETHLDYGGDPDRYLKMTLDAKERWISERRRKHRDASTAPAPAPGRSHSGSPSSSSSTVPPPPSNSKAEL